MPRRDALAFVVLITLACGACSRLTFFRPDASPGKYTKTSPTYDLHDSDATRRRIAVGERLGLAQSHLASGQLDAAEAEVKAALKADPTSADAYTVLAVIADRRGQAEQAGGYYVKATELAPNQGAALNNYGAWLCGNGRATESLGWFDRALADRGYRQQASALSNAGACALKAGHTGRVEHDLRAALTLEPDNATALDAMADYQYRSGNYMDARAFSQRRLAAAQSTPDTLRLASQIEDKLGDPTAAAGYVQRLRTEFPQARAAPSGEVGRP
ncbi:MAG: type IV pilus biogenesis/stability protein PilW [Luteimonas sp.]